MKRVVAGLADPAPSTVRRRLSSKTSPLPTEQLVELPAVEPQQPCRAVDHSRGASRPQQAEPVACDQEQDAVYDGAEVARKEKFDCRVLCQRYRRWMMSKMMAEKDIEDESELARLRRRCDLRKMSAEQKLVAAKELFKASPELEEERAIVLEYFQEKKTQYPQKCEVPRSAGCSLDLQWAVGRGDGHRASATLFGRHSQRHLREVARA